MINKSLSEANLAPVTYRDDNADHIGDDVETNHVPIALPVVTSTEFITMHANVCIKALTGDDTVTVIEGDVVTNVNGRYCDMITKSMCASINAGNSVPMIDYRIVIEGLKNSNTVPIKFVDRNELTKPSWCRVDNVLIDEQTGDTVSTTGPSTVIEIEDDFKKLNVNTMSVLAIDDCFWDNVRSAIDDKEALLSCDKENERIVDVLACDVKELEKPTVAWNVSNEKTIAIHEQQTEAINKHKCEWQNVVELFRQKRLSIGNITAEQAKDAVMLLMASFGEQITICETMFETQLVPSHFILSANAINELHQGVINEHGKECQACASGKRSGLLKHAIVAAIIGVIRFNDVSFPQAPYSDMSMQSNIQHMNYTNFF